MALAPTDVGARIREERLARGWTHEEFARRLGVNWRTVQRWQKGDLPRLATLHQIADVFEIPVDELVEPAATKQPSEAQQEILARLEAVFDRLGRVESELARLRGSQPAPPERRAV